MANSNFCDRINILGDPYGKLQASRINGILGSYEHDKARAMAGINPYVTSTEADKKHDEDKRKQKLLLLLED